MRTQLLSAAIAGACAFAGVLCTASEATAGNARGAARDVAAADAPGNGNGFVRGNNGNGRGIGPGVQRGGGATRPTREGVCPGVKVYGPLGQSGQSHTAHADFAEVDVVSNETVVEGAWAGMSYFWIGSEFSYVLNVHQVPAESGWTLFIEAGDGSAICLGAGSANRGGQLHLHDSIELDGNLPPDLDPFVSATAEDPGLLLLAPSESVDCETGELAADVEALIVSDEPIRYVDSDVLVCPTP
jgi:hypothetical protein